MSNTTPGSEPLRAVVDNYGTLSGKTDAIPEDLQPYAKQVLQMDPIRDVPGNVKQLGGYRPIKLKVDGLPPELRGEVYRKLERMPNMSAEDRAKYEDQFVAEAIRGRQGAIRGLTGVGRDALPFHREQANIAMEVRTLQEKRASYVEQVDKIVDVRKAEDPVTGEIVAEPVYWLPEYKRENFRNVIADIDRNIRLLVDNDGKPGIEGKKRLDKALLESAQAVRQRNAVLAEEADAQKLAAERARQARVERRAEVISRMQPDGL